MFTKEELRVINRLSALLYKNPYFDTKSKKDQDIDIYLNHGYEKVVEAVS